jgi:hypothetical protein
MMKGHQKMMGNMPSNQMPMNGGQKQQNMSIGISGHNR